MLLCCFKVKRMMMHPWMISLLMMMWSSCCSGQQQVYQVLCPSHTVQAMHGDNVVLPCQVHPPVDMTGKRLEWSRTQLEPPYVYLRSLLEERDDPGWNERYLSNRNTFVSEEELTRGNVSLAINNVNGGDEGTFRCAAPGQTAPGQGCSVKLVVVMVATPSISVTGITDGGLTLTCDSDCWHPEPVVTWLDGEGNLLPIQHMVTTKHEDCYYIQAIVTVTRAANLTCRVSLPHTNHSDEAHNVYRPGFGAGQTVDPHRPPMDRPALQDSQGKQWPWLFQVELPGESLLRVSSTTGLELDSDVVAESSSNGVVELADGKKTADKQVDAQQSVSALAYQEQTLALQRMASSMESMQSTWTHMSTVISAAVNSFTARNV